jgi:large subunit GTPase 1
MGKKKVAVASMPGKTKHFQTLKLTENVIMCDCPGLVFPKVS